MDKREIVTRLICSSWADQELKSVLVFADAIIASTRAELEAKRVALPDEVVAAISDLKKTFPNETYFGTGGLVRVLINWLDEQESRDAEA